MGYIILVEQDSSIYKDKTGEEYHFPNAKYLSRINIGDKVIFYKGKLKSSDKKMMKSRLSKEPHYFGTGIVKDLLPDSEFPNQTIAIIENYISFPKAVHFKIDGNYIEDTNDYSNHFMGGNSVRIQPKEVFEKIIKLAEVDLDNIEDSEYNDFIQGETGSLITYQEGDKKKKFTTIFERNPKLREQAIIEHGLSCFVCEFNFKKTYGEWGEGFIHIHHIVPISEKGGLNQIVNPKTDLVPLCPNCHSMIHRKKSITLSIEQLKNMMND
jgi:predicted HNH restriction endonuclease